MYTAVLSKPSAKYLENLPLKQAELIIDKVEDLRREPFQNSISLQGPLRDLRRSKAGKFRIIFELVESKKEIIIKAIGPRGDIYKR
ncbi:MAG: type II toxin-antitoxin system RelE/ParE family toxin [Armatimonadota bacterium]